MAVVDRISPSDWLVVWKKQSDARVGRAVAEPEGGVRADCRGCNGTTRLLLPLSAEGGLAGRRGKLLVGLQLRVDKVSPARPVEWVALLSGPTPDDLNFVKKLESLPVMGAKGRSWSSPACCPLPGMESTTTPATSLWLSTNLRLAATA